MWLQLKEEYHSEPLHRQIENIYRLYPLPSQHTPSPQPSLRAQTHLLKSLITARPQIW